MRLLPEKGRILKKLAGIKLVKNRPALYA